MFEYLLEECLADEQYKPKLSTVRKRIITYYIVISLICFGSYFISPYFEKCTVNIPLIISIISYLLVLFIPLFSDKIIIKYEKSGLTKQNERLDTVTDKPKVQGEKSKLAMQKDRIDVVDNIFKNISKEFNSDFYKSPSFIETVIDEGEAKIKMKKEQDLIPKIINVLLIPIFLMCVDKGIGVDAAISWLALIIILMLSAVLHIWEIALYISSPLNDPFHWNRLLNTLKIVAAKEKQNENK
ncbi:MAG: hypothetical protein LBL87_01995 [Ruminococcus sp.]|nr:hypothetical protein [Ruminococcus sp.]